MTFWLLTAITASRLLVCAPAWFWCWWKRPRWMVLWMSLIMAWFVISDTYDGNWARAAGVQSEFGYWLDHVGDFAFFGVFVVTIVKGTREPELNRRRRRGPSVTARPPSGRDGEPR